MSEEFIKDIHKERYKLAEEISRLRELLKEAHEVLGFYGEAKNYNVSVSGHCVMFGDADNYPQDAKFGTKARAMKEKIEKEISGGK